MSNRLFNPDITFVDSTGAPYAGAQLFFYASGTSTKQNTYSDSALTIANANPVVLDSAGRAGPIFLQNLQYKVVLAPSTDTDPPTSPIWTQDPVYTSDYSTAAQFQSGSGNPSGVVAGNAGSATIKASVYWDFSNSILYVCTTTGSATTAVWTAVNASTAAAVIPTPQGYLTPTSGVPIIPSDVTAATTIYYTPYNGLLVPIYNGASFSPTSIVSELQYTLTSNLVANNIYDCYIFSLNGVATLGTGPSWTAGTGGSVTAGSCARGTGPGGATLSMVQGIWTNTVSMTIRYGNGTFTVTVSPNQATYVGSIFIDGTNGQVSCYRTWGQNRKWGIWNSYNRNPIVMQMGDSTASWNYENATIRQSNGNIANSTTVFTGLPEETCAIQFNQAGQLSLSTQASPQMKIGIGVNSTAFSGTCGLINGANNSPNARVDFYNNMIAQHAMPPSLGINVISSLEAGTALASTSHTFFGTQLSMTMQTAYRG